jgi:hypothetical protein
MPDSNTMMLKNRPISLAKVISPKPNVVITVNVQYTPVIQEW